ncbi:hypothetical protein DPM19_21725 [Actinomadura craniellae]|uniref:Uncharacterized protein n=1 Tax=Actinomadura craniellae TaxID=2231787 RepID=A0A365H1Y2_9ACTN|nr:M23 family metallopeptidase [Actinomadura craniellae]RAY13115.1 hypothetical protein DPM19_21725 [Actinomadura craniellae]
MAGRESRGRRRGAPPEPVWWQESRRDHESRREPGLWWEKAEQVDWDRFWESPSRRTRRRAQAPRRTTTPPGAKRGAPRTDPPAEPARPARPGPPPRGRRGAPRTDPTGETARPAPPRGRRGGPRAESRSEPARRERPARGGKQKRAARRDTRPMRAVAPRRAHAPVDRVTGGTVAVVALVGLAMIAVVERSVLEGPLPGSPPEQAALGAPVPRASPDRTGKPAPPAPQAPPIDTLNDQIRNLTLTQRGPVARQAYGAPGQPPRLGATRFSLDRTWAFGTTAIPVPAERAAMPQVALFLARWSDGQWRTALAGTPEFTEMLGQAPAQMMPASERRILTRYGEAAAVPKPAGLMLPWRIGGSWTMTAGAAETGQGTRPLGVIAFRGGDGRVLAPADGRLYRFCGATPGRGLVMIIHDNGLASVYYQLTQVTTVPDGSPVRRGTLLGRTGVDRPCGGASAALPQVLFSLRHGADDVPFDGTALGGWRLRERASPAMGWAERGDKQVLPGGALTNFGPLPPPAVKPTPAPKPSTAPPDNPLDNLLDRRAD